MQRTFLRKTLITTYKRTMSTKPQFLVQVFDHPGTIQKRIDVRQAHLSAVGQNQAVKAGGAFFSKDPTPEDPMPFAGSVLIMEADSQEEVRKALKEDIYYKSGVWDVDGAKITPMKVAFVRPQ